MLEVQLFCNFLFLCEDGVEVCLSGFDGSVAEVGVYVHCCLNAAVSEEFGGCVGIYAVFIKHRCEVVAEGVRGEEGSPMDVAVDGFRLTEAARFHEARPADAEFIGGDEACVGALVDNIGVW